MVACPVCVAGGCGAGSRSRGVRLSHGLRTISDLYGRRPHGVPCLYRNVRYPREAFDRGEQGRILVSFVIDTLGNVTQVGPLSAAARGDEECGKESPGTDERYKELLPERKAGPIGISESPALVREAVRVVRSSPRWAPARMGGGIANSAKVPVKYLLPIDFLLKPDTSHRWPAVVPPAEWSPEYIFCPEPQR